MSVTNTNDANDTMVSMPATVWNAALRSAFARGAEAMRDTLHDKAVMASAECVGPKDIYVTPLPEYCE